MLQLLARLTCVSFIWLIGAALASAQDLGDAPEGAPAYPSLGVMGGFPTCVLSGPAGFVQHGGANAFWGASRDAEVDGNGGLCQFPPYDMDECEGGDAGLSRPVAFTIGVGNNVVTCSGKAPVSLGGACEPLHWGTIGNLEMRVSNFAGQKAFVNIWFDWNQDGRWGGQLLCPSGGQPLQEHAVVDAEVPDGYSGPLSSLVPGSFQIGPNAGYVWARFSISVPSWQANGTADGGGIYDEGETEDYLLRIDPAVTSGELGDAPEDAPAYPGISAVVGKFPTCVAIGPPGYVYHAQPQDVYFGPTFDLEIEGNASFCPQPPYDLDECDAGGGDSGLLVPDPFTIDATNTIVHCPNASTAQPLGKTCDNIAWGGDLDIEVTNNSSDDAYVNVLLDLDRDGSWGGTTIVCGNNQAEHVLHNFVVPAGHSGPLSQLAPPGFQLAVRPGYTWCRFTVTQEPVPGNWDGTGYFGDGETEDYLLAVGANPSDTAPAAGTRLAVLATPNPFNPATQIVFDMPRPGVTRVSVHDIAGNHLSTLLDAYREAGQHVLPWRGTDAAGRRLGSGIYIVRVQSGDEARATKVVIMK